jgi:hypothetical protein
MVGKVVLNNNCLITARINHMPRMIDKFFYPKEVLKSPPIITCYSFGDVNGHEMVNMMICCNRVPLQVFFK